METLRKWFKDEDRPFPARLMIMAALGIVLLLASGLFLKGEGKSLSQMPKTEGDGLNVGIPMRQAYENELESRLSDLLSKVEGAGKVEVMITLSQGAEIILAENMSSNETWMQENDSAGGSRENRTKQAESSKIMLQGTGGQQPLVIKEIVPKVEGIIIVARGGDNILIKEALMNAAKTVLGVEMHKIQVLKMKE